jgi:hypothetical protein
LARGLSAVAARLGPQDAGRAADALTRALAETTDADALGALARGLSAVAARLGPQDGARLCSQAADALTRALAKTTHPKALGALAQGLSEVLVRVDSPELSRRGVAAGALVASFAGTSQLFTPLALLGPAGEPLPCPLTAQQLVDLLKQPICVGPARRLILDQLKGHYRRGFADHWEFVRFAEERGLGLDFTSPPQRPAGPPNPGGK